MKVLHFYKTSWPQSLGGVESLIHGLCTASSAYGVHNTVLSLAKDPSPVPIAMGSYDVYQAKEAISVASTGFSVSAIKLFKQLADEADIIHYHFPNPFADVLNLFWRIKKPSLVTYHSDIIKQKNLLKIYRPLMSQFLGSVDKIISTSPNYFSTSEALEQYKDKVSIIPIGIDIDQYPKLDQERVNFWRDKLPKPFFLFIGAMRYYKGLHIALEAIKDTDIHLAIGGVKGIENELRQQAKDSGLSNVSFLGHVSEEDKIALLHLCYGFVFPSHLRSEAFGISLLEAAAFGRPLISCEIGTGTSFVNEHQVTGLVIKPSCPVELQKAMQYLLDNPEVAQTFGQNGIKRTQKLFTADQQARSYVDEYQALLNQRDRDN